MTPTCSPVATRAVTEILPLLSGTMQGFRVWMSKHGWVLLPCVLFVCVALQLLRRPGAALETEVLEGVVRGVIAANKESVKLRAVQQEHAQQLASLRAELKDMVEERKQLRRGQDDLRAQIQANRLQPGLTSEQPKRSLGVKQPPRDMLPDGAGCGPVTYGVTRAPEESPRDATPDDTRLCAQYNWKPLGRQERPRRLFLGALVANEERLIFELLAAETLDLVSAFAFVEANMTLDNKANPRELRFCRGSTEDGQWLRGLFAGKGASVSIAAYTDMTHAKRDELEYIIRETIASAWVEQGMTHNDVGVLVDADESFSHQFMQAMKRCDVPGFRLKQPNPCRNPKIVSNTLIMEGYFDCVWNGEHNRGFHPDAVIGQCLEALNPGVDNSKVRREWNWHVSGGVDRPEQDGLWNMADLKFREGASPLGQDKIVTGGEWPTAFHFHNFWGADSRGTKALQFKYAAYGHSLGDTEGMGLEDIASVFKDVAFMINCFKGIHNDARSTKYREPLFWRTKEYNDTDLSNRFPVPRLFYNKPELVARYFVTNLGNKASTSLSGVSVHTPPPV